MKNRILDIKTTLGLVISCSLLTAGALQAKPDKDKDKSSGHSEKGKDHGNKGAKKEAHEHEKEARKAAEKRNKENAEWAKKRFRDEDRDGVIRYFYQHRDQDNGLPPGLAKNLRRGKPLPSGWRDKVYNGYVIEDDYADYFSPLANKLFPGLNIIPDTRLYRYGDRVVRVHEPTREIIDMFVVPTIRLD